MQFEGLLKRLELLSSSQRNTWLVIAVVTFWVVKSVFDSWARRVKVPRVGNLWASSLSSQTKNREQLQYAYQKFPDGLFKMKMWPYGTMIIANGPKLIEEIRIGASDVFDATAAVLEPMKIKYTMSVDLAKTDPNFEVIRNHLTKNLVPLFSELMEEVESAFEDIFDLPKNGDWKAIPMFDTANKLAARSANRVFIGSPICRDETYLKLARDNLTHIIMRSFLITLFPSWSHPIVGPLFGGKNTYYKLFKPILEPVINERRAKMKTHGKEWTDKQNDYLNWVMELAGPEESTKQFISEIIGINFSAIHTTGITVTHALYYVAAYPEYQKILSQEAKPVIQQHGWSKLSMQKLYKLDSFLRESARLNPVNLIALTRYMSKDYKFSNGVTVKRGNWITASAYSIHMDERYYPEASEFKPWRFSDLRESAESEATRHQYITTTPDFMAFGAGKHSCPGRFFAANELKALLCFILIHYDVKLADEGAGRPPNAYFGASVIPNQKAHLMFRLKAA